MKARPRGGFLAVGILLSSILLVESALAVDGASPVALSADGIIRSTSGGFQFPDGTVQKTASPMVPPSVTVQVDCDAGETLTDALAVSAGELTVEFTGICQENLIIPRDRVRLVGTSADAEIRGAGLDVVTVRGASGVSLQNFAVREGGGGVLILDGAAVRLEGLTVRNNLGSGVFVAGGQAWIDALIVEDSGADGIGAWGSSRVIFGNTAPTVVRRSGRLGIVGSGGSDVSAVVGGAQVEAENNSAAGLLLQLGATSQGLELQASANETGMVVGGEAVFGGHVDIRENTGTGLFIAAAGNVFVQGQIQENGIFGVHTDAATVDMREATISGNAQGVVLDGARLHIHNTAVSDPVELIFGTEATFNGGNSFTGGVSCDETVLVRGDVACTSASSSSRTDAPEEVVARAFQPVPAPLPLER